MRIYRIGIIGHRQHRIWDKDDVRRLCFQTTLTLVDQYEPNPVRLNLTGAPSAGQWFGQACAEYGISYHLFLPCDSASYVAEWNEPHREEFGRQLGGCYGLTQIGRELTKDTVCGAARALVDDSDFLVSFWEGNKSGLTYETIKYAVETSKLVLDGLEDLALITKKDLIKGDEE